MKELLNYVLKPSSMAEELTKKDTKFKIIVILTIAVISGLLGILIYELSFGKLIEPTFMNYLTQFGVGVISFIINTVIIWGALKIFGGKSHYLDFLFITSASRITFLMFDVIILITIIVGFTLPSLMGSSLLFIPFALWFLFVWSKGISKIEKISETRITLVVILSVVFYMFVEPIISGFLGA